MNQATTNDHLDYSRHSIAGRTVTDGFPVGEDVFAGARTSSTHNTTNAPMFQVSSVGRCVGFHLDFGAWKGDDSSRREFLNVISQGFPFNPAYTLLPLSLHTVNDVHDVL